MPSRDAVDRERAVVRRVLAAIRSASGLGVELVGSPDEERASNRFPAELTVDAVLRLTDGRTECDWALDVVNLSWNPRLIPAVRGFADRLQASLEELVAEHSVVVTVLYQPPIGHHDRGDAYLERILEFTRGRLDAPSPEFDQLVDQFVMDDGTTDIQIEVAADPPGSVQLVVALSESSNILEALEASFAPTVRKKLEGQLLSAHRAGYPTILAVDRVGPDSPFGNNFLPSPAAIGQVIGRTVARHEHAGGTHALDLAVAVSEDSCAPVFGYWPDNPGG